MLRGMQKTVFCCRVPVFILRRFRNNTADPAFSLLQIHFNILPGTYGRG